MMRRQRADEGRVQRERKNKGETMQLKERAGEGRAIETNNYLKN